MTSLTQMFDDETRPRAASDAAAIDRVANLTVSGAKRRRAVRVGAQTLAAVVVAGVVVAGGSMLLGRGDATPPAVSETPSPTPSASPHATPPGEITVADSRLPQALPMTDADWDRLDASWDIEFAAFINVGPDASGSTAAAYVTEPGGERLLAYASATLDVAAPILLGWHPASAVVTLFDRDANMTVVLDLRTGVATATESPSGLQLHGAHPLGMGPDGRAYFAAELAEANGEVTFTAFVQEETHAQGVLGEGVWEMSPLWEGLSVYRGEDGLGVADLPGGTVGEAIEGTETCQFRSWTLEGAFTAQCGTTNDTEGAVIEFDPATGAATELIPVQDLEAATGEDGPAPIDTTPEFTAIDSTRRLVGPGAWGYSLRPPSVIEAGGEVRDLAEAFANIPDSYAAVFGWRG